MKRSEINRLQRDALELFAEYRFSLPLFARWNEAALVGEVSQVNDDLTDNYFLDTVGRFADIEEDEPKLFPLWNELASLLQR
jgi:D-lyxose ketol-isomerase